MTETAYGLTNREQAIISALSMFLLGVGAINPASLPLWLQITIIMSGAFGLGLKELLGDAAPLPNNQNGSKSVSPLQ